MANMNIVVEYGMRIVPPSGETKSEYTEIGQVTFPLHPWSLENPMTAMREEIALGLEAAAAAIRATEPRSETE